jgi:hypothetical protein
MKTLSHAMSATLLLIVLTFGITGCATGPTYQYTEQKDSASVHGTYATYATDVSTSIVKIDGLLVTGIFTTFPERYVSPGNHTIGLDIVTGADIDPDSRQDCSQSVEVNFLANHNYRFDASNGFLILWDETGDTENPIEVRRWVNFDDEFADNEPIQQVDIGGAEHVRPPLDRDEHASHADEHPKHSGGTPSHQDRSPSHQGRPPSIPHNPRPKSGGGGKRSSGGGGKRK